MSELYVIYVVGALGLVLGLGAFFGAPYVPTRRRDLKRMFQKLYPLSADDVVLDLGSGDGLVLREVTRRGAKAVGFEINPIFFAISWLTLRGNSRASVRLTNAWTTDFPPNTSLVYIFSVRKDGRRLARKVQKEANRFKRPLTLVCYGNPLPGDAIPIKTFQAYFMYRFEPLHSREA